MSGEPLAYALFAVFGLACIIAVASRFGVVAPSLLSYVTVLTIALTRYFQEGLSAPDAIYYDNMGVAIARGQSSVISAGKEGLSETLGIVYSLFGHDPIFGLWLNAIACGLMVAGIGGIAERLDLPVRPAAWIAALYPAVLVWGSLLLREAIVWMLLSGLIFAVAGIVTRSGRLAWNIVLLILSFVGLLAFRGSVGIAIFIAALVAIVASQRGDKYRQGGTYLLLAIVFVIIYMSPLSAQIEAVLGRYTVERVEISREALQRTADSGFVIGSGNPFAAALPVLPRVLFGPFVWEFSSVGVAGVLEGMLWVILLVLAVRGWWRLPIRRVGNVLVVPALTLLCVLAVTSGNYGTMVRLRTQVAIMLIPLAARGLSRTRRLVLTDHVHQSFVPTAGAADR